MNPNLKNSRRRRFRRTQLSLAVRRARMIDKAIFVAVTESLVNYRRKVVDQNRIHGRIYQQEWSRASGTGALDEFHANRVLKAKSASAGRYEVMEKKTFAFTPGSNASSAKTFTDDGTE